MLYLLPAQTQNASHWYPLLAEDRLWLGTWLPELKQIQSLAEAEAYIQKDARLDFYLAAHHYEIWEEEELIGLISLHSARLLQGSVDLGYWLGRAYRGKGYTAQACEVLISHSFHHYPQLQQICISSAAENYASQAVAQKLGMQLQEKGAIVRYSMPRALWMEHYFEEDDLFQVLEL